MLRCPAKQISDTGSLYGLWQDPGKLKSSAVHPLAIPLVISYRSIKRLLGETSLERKCRFLFGAGLLVLIIISFSIYARMTHDLVYEQQKRMAGDLVPVLFKNEHLLWEVAEQRTPGGEDAAAGGVTTLMPELSSSYQSLRDGRDGVKGWSVGEPTSDLDYEAQEQLRAGRDSFSRVKSDEEGKVLVYFEMLTAGTSCLSCHNSLRQARTEVSGEPFQELKADDEMGLVRVTLKLDQTDGALNKNTLFLLALAILTAFLAMLGAYAIVRYVIVKPVLHLKDVSEEISRGNLELRADINTGDEFEQLSHAFNRMLRHMMTVNDELRTLNTDLDQKFDQLAQVNLQLYETGKLKDEFLATMSHELRTPLNSIIGFSDVLISGDTLSEKEQRYVTTIQTSGNNLLALINDLLDLAKVESGKMQVQPVEFAVEELIERQTTNIQPLAEKKNIELRWDVPPGIPKLLQDFGKMSQILNNLLSNAIKFTPEGGRVRVTGQQLDRENIELLVEDTGIGIPLDEQETVFEKFRQGNTTPGKRNHTTREYEGTGLGLSIVRELSHLLGGEVTLISEFGKGSIFKVRIPIEVNLEINEPVDLEADTEVDTRLATR